MSAGDLVLAPFSNSAIRDWPVEHWRALVGLFLAGGFAGAIRVIGTANQRLAACEIVRPHPADRVLNECGRLAWEDALTVVRGAACVVSNNSGIGHLAGHWGVATVCVFGGSHQRQEWAPKGARVVVLTRAIGCSPCQLDHGQFSPYGKACLREIGPHAVHDAALGIMARGGAGTAPAEGNA